MMRLGIDGRELRAGLRTGIGRYVVEVLRACSKAGWECRVYGTPETSFPESLPGVNPCVLGDGWTTWWDQISLPRRLTHDRISLFLSPYMKGPLIAPCPVVLTIHDLLFIQYPGVRRPFYDRAMTGLARLYASRATAIITDSEYSKGIIVKRLHVHPKKIRVIPIALHPGFRPTPLTSSVRDKYQLTSPYILYVGNFKPHKNLHRLLQAFASLDNSVRHRVQLVLAGSDRPNQHALQRTSHALGISDHVQFPGRIPDEELPAVYSGAVFTVLPSLVEGFGLTALEAMGCGCPVGAANRASIPEVVGEAAILFDPEKIESIATAMADLLTQGNVRERCRQRGLARVAEFSPANTTAHVLSFLREIHQDQPCRGRKLQPST